MKTYFSKDYFLYIVAKILILALTILPMRLNLWFGRRFGEFAIFLNNKRKRIAYANLRLAFSDKFYPPKLKGLLFDSYRNLGQNFVELLSLQKIDRRYTDKFFSSNGFERIDNAINEDKGIVFVTAHFGNWELSSNVCALKGYPITVLARQQKFKRLNALLNNLRQLGGGRVITKGIETREIIKAIRNKEIFGMLADQDAGKKGVFADFFKKSTSFPAGLIGLAARLDSAVFPSFIKRKKGPFHNVTVHPPLKNNSIEEMIAEYAKILEGEIRQNPTQWLWMHKRWKSSPTRFALVLNDQKAGHLNQSLAVLKAFENLAGENLRYKIIDIKFKNNFRRNLLNLFAVFSSSRCQGCMKCVRFCLEKRPFEELIRQYADIIISCGNSLSGLNLFLSYENNAKNIHIMRPSFLGTRRFSLNIIPGHDNPKKRKNVAITLGCPNMVDSDYIKEKADALFSKGILNKSDLEKKPNIGLLIGGDNRSYSIPIELMEEAINNILSANEKLKGQILVTTSRRTSKGIEDLIEKRFKGLDSCKLLVIANKKNLPDAVGGILGVSDIVIVSSDSVSMVSEAASSGKYIIVFELIEKAKKAKYGSFLKNLAKDRHVTIAKPKELRAALEKIWGERPPVKRLDDDKVIFEAVKRIL